MAARDDGHRTEHVAPVLWRATGSIASFVRRAWPLLRIAFTLGVIALVWWALDSHRSELAGLSAIFRHLRWWWIPPAVAAEMASLWCFAGLQRELLGSGGLVAPWRPLLKVTFAAQAITNSIPGGNAASAVYGFRWYRRFGADSTLATWSLVGMTVASVVSLSLIATAGLALATEEGASFDLIPVIVGALLLTVAIGALFVYERPLSFIVAWAIRISRSLIGRPGGDEIAHIQRIVGWVTTVRLGRRQISKIVAWGSANWLLDCSCFAMMFLAVDSAIPWKGLLLAYGAGQLAANLPITPGGLGAVEGSITIALVAFGGARLTTVDAVLMYRLVSFWFVLVVGWGLWAVLALEVRRGRWTRSALTAPAEAGVEREIEADTRAVVGTGHPSAVGP
jgi:putative heme transporter